MTQNDNITVQYVLINVLTPSISIPTEYPLLKGHCDRKHFSRSPKSVLCGVLMQSRGEDVIVLENVVSCIDP